MRVIHFQLPFFSGLFILADLILLGYQFIRIYRNPDDKGYWGISILLVILILCNSVAAGITTPQTSLAVNIATFLLAIVLLKRKRPKAITNLPQALPEIKKETEPNRTTPDERLLANCHKYNLSPRETEVVQLLMKGLTYQEIAGKLHITLSTVDSHAQNSYKKLGVNNKIALINKLAE